MDVFTLISTYMATKVISAQHIMRNVTLLTFMIPVGIQVAASILVGNNVGANRVVVGQEYAKMCVKTAVAWALGTILLLVLFREQFLSVFSTDAEV